MRLAEHQRLVREIIDELGLDDDEFSRVNVGFVVESDPDLMTMIRKRAAATSGENQIWKRAFRHSKITDLLHKQQENLERYRRIVVMGETATRIRSLRGFPDDDVMILFTIMNDPAVHEICDWEEPSVGLSHAAMTVAAISRHSNGDSPVDIDALKDASLYVVEHLEAVTNILPELFVRNAFTRRDIARLVELQSPSLVSGML